VQRDLVVTFGVEPAQNTQQYDTTAASGAYFGHGLGETLALLPAVLQCGRHGVTFSLCWLASDVPRTPGSASTYTVGSHREAGMSALGDVDLSDELLDSVGTRSVRSVGSAPQSPPRPPPLRLPGSGDPSSTRPVDAATPPSRSLTGRRSQELSPSRSSAAPGTPQSPRSLQAMLRKVAGMQSKASATVRQVEQEEAAARRAGEQLNRVEDEQKALVRRLASLERTSERHPSVSMAARGALHCAMLTPPYLRATA